MVDPPCQGDFLIQSVDITQIHDESDDLMPCYMVRASSVRFDLQDLLLQIVAQANVGTGSTSTSGLVTAAQTLGSNVGLSLESQRVFFAYHGPSVGGAPGAVTYHGSYVGASPVSPQGTSPVYTTNDGFGTPMGVPADRADFRWAVCRTNTTPNNTSAVVTNIGWMLEENPSATFYVRSGSSVAGLIYWAGFFAVAFYTVPTSANPGSMPYFGFRYAPESGDGGWVGVLQPRSSGAHRETKTQVLAPVIPHTDYLLECKAEGGPVSQSMVCSFRVNQGSWQSITFLQTANPTQNPTWDMPILADGGFGNLPLAGVVGCVTKASLNKSLGFRFMTVAAS